MRITRAKSLSSPRGGAVNPAASVRSAANRSHATHAVHPSTTIAPDASGSGRARRNPRCSVFRSVPAIQTASVSSVIGLKREQHLWTRRRGCVFHSPVLGHPGPSPSTRKAKKPIIVGFLVFGAPG